VRLGAESGPIAAELNDIGASLASRGQPSEAEPLVRRAIDLDTHLVQARKNLVLILLDQHRVEEAKASLADAIKATGDRPEYTNLLPSEKVDVI
jgi:Flp pilus assembly protein TadD